LAVSERIQQISQDVLQINQGSLYPALHRLEHQGWIEAEWKVSELGRRAKYYRLTAAGRRQLAVELDKLVSFTGGGAIDEAAVAAVVGVRRGETLGAFLDAVAARDVVKALDLLPGVLAQPKASAVTIVMALTAQTLAIAWARARRERGLPPGRLHGGLFGLLKEAGFAYTGRPWGEAVEAWTRAASRPDEDDTDGALLDAALDALLAADFALKETRLSSDEQLLTNLVLTLCTVQGPAAGTDAPGNPGRRGSRATTAEHA
jgi:DNA-binding PadR family transcriptional regulator